MSLIRPLSEPVQEKISMGSRVTKRLIRLINDLLDLEKMETGRIDLACTTVSLKDIVEKSLEAVRPVASEKGLQFECPEQDVEFSADSDRLVQVIINLTSNAVKFSPAGGTIKISGVVSGNQIKIGISDQGCGIPKDSLGKIFERFEQAKQAKKTKAGGTGLGLAICKKIFEGHGGEIGVESEEGKGSTFWFSLPLQPIEAAQPAV